MNASRLLSTIKRMTEQGYAVIDLETTGLDPARCEIAEIGLLVNVPGKVIQPMSWLVKCTQTEEAARVTGITQEVIDRGGIPLSDAMNEVIAAVGQVKVIVGHNYLRYDAEVLRYASVIEPRAKSFSNLENVVDSGALFKGGRMGEGMRDDEDFLHYQMRILETKVFGLKYSLDFVCDELHINHSDCKAHRALGDVVMCHRVLQEMIKRFETYEEKRVKA